MPNDVKLCNLMSNDINLCNLMPNEVKLCNVMPNDVVTIIGSQDIVFGEVDR